MRIIAFVLFMIVVIASQGAYAAKTVGFKQITLPDAEHGRPLHVTTWYPTDYDGPQTIVAENPAFVGLSVAKDANPGTGRHPLVVLSHGYGGSWRNLSWLAGELVQKGYIVAAPDHPGTTAFDTNSPETKKLWERPRDLGRVIDALLAKPDLAGEVAPNRIAAIGHSLGGWTVTELAGGRLDADLVTKDCDARFGSISCKLFTHLGIGAGTEATANLRGDLRDARVRAVVTLDLGLASGLKPESLADVHVAFLVIAAGTDIDGIAAEKAEVAATNKDSSYLAQYLPKASASYAEIPDALHFSFMQLCKPGAIELIKEETPGEEIVCKDGGSRDRAGIHREITDMIITFLAEALPAE